MGLNKRIINVLAISIFLFVLALLVYAADIPTITIESNSVQNGSFYNASQNATLEINITTDELANATFSLDAGVTNYSLFTINTNATTPQYLNFSIEGVNTLYVYVMNYTNATHSNFTTVTYTVDTTNPSTTLDLPTDASYNNSNQVTFYFTPTDTNIETCVLYHNESGTFAANESTSGALTSGVQTSLTAGFVDQTIIWNVWCNDTAGNSAFAAANYSHTIDTQAPTVSLTTPVNGFNTSTLTQEFAFIPTETNIDTCFLYHNASGTFAINETNSTGFVAGASNSISATLPDQSVVLWGVWCNDSAGNAALSTSNYTITFDAASPALTVSKVWDATDKDNFYRGGEDIKLMINFTDFTPTTVTINWSTIDNNVSAIENCTSDCYVTYPVNDSSSVGVGGAIVIVASDVNGNSNSTTSSYVIFNMGTPSGFNGTGTTNFSLVDNMSAVDLVVEIDGVGVINFTDKIDLTNESVANELQNFNNNVLINMTPTPPVIYFNSTWFNKVRTVTSSNIALTFGNIWSNYAGTPTIQKDSSACASCSTPVSAGTNDLYFTATGFSNYTVLSDTTEPYPNSKGTEGSTTPGGTAYIYANWSDASLGSGMNVSLYDSSWTQLQFKTANNTNPMTNFSYTITSTDESQTLTFRINATDAAGNENGTGDLTVTVNGVAPTIATISPANGTITTDNTTTFTITATDASQINCSLVTVDLGEAVYGSNESSFSCTDGTSITASVTTNATTTDGVKTVMINVTDKWGTRASNTTYITIDTTNPTVSLDSPANNTPDTDGSVTFLFTPTDANIETCTLYHDATGTFAANTSNSSLTSGSQASIITTLPESSGINWNIWCNDSAGNAAFNTTWNYTVPINAATPSITAISTSGTSSSTSSGTATISATTSEAATCWYKSANFSALNTTGATLMSGGSTTSSSFTVGYSSDTTIGPYYLSCRDTLGTNMSTSNSTGSISVTVTAATTTTSSSGGGGTISKTADGTSSQYWKALSPNALGVMKLFNDKIPVNLVKFETANRLLGITLTIAALDDVPEGITAVEGIVLKYIEFTKKKFTDDDIKSIKIQFKVDKSWVETNKFKEVDLWRYTDAGWQKLDTKQVDSDAKMIKYEATAPGFSYFAITGNGHVTEAVVEEVAEAEEVTETATEEQTTESIIPEIPTQPKKPWTGWVLAVVILAIGGIVFIFMKSPKKKSKFKMTIPKK